MPDDPFHGLDLTRLVPNIPDFRKLSEFRSPLVESLEHNYASAFHERLMKMINDFDAALDQDHEVGARLISFGESLVFHITGIGFWNPSLITFSGTTDDGETG